MAQRLHVLGSLANLRKDHFSPRDAKSSFDFGMHFTLTENTKVTLPRLRRAFGDNLR